MGMEEKSDDFILGQVMRNLKSIFPTVNDPTTVMITRWGQDENFLGSYSFNQVGRTSLMMQASSRKSLGISGFQEKRHIPRGGMVRRRVHGKPGKKQQEPWRKQSKKGNRGLGELNS